MKSLWFARWGGCRRTLVICVVLVCGLARTPTVAVAEDPPTQAKSTAAAIRQYRDAVAFQNRGVYDLASDEWESFLKNHAKDPLAPKARHYLGVCRLQLKQYDEAAAAFATVLKDSPNFELAEESYLDLGLAYMGAGQAGKAEQFDKAAESFRAMMEKFPKAKEAGKALYSLGDAYYARGKKDEAIKAYSQALERESIGPLRPDAQYALGVALEEAGKQAEAAAAYDLFLKDNKEHALRAEVILRRGDLYFAAKDYTNAVSWFASAAAAKDFALADRALSRQAESLYEQKKHAEAAALFASLPAKFPKSDYAGKAALYAGTCYYLAGNLDEAGKWLAQALAGGGDAAPEAGHWLAKTLLKQKKFEEAQKIVAQVLPQAADGPFAANLMLDQAEALYEQEAKRKDSVAAYAAVAQKFPQHAVAPQALYLASFAALGLGDNAAALAQAEAFLKAYPSDPLTPEVKVVAAEADLQLNQFEQAEKLYDDLLAGQPAHADSDQWKVRRALALSLQKKYADVIKALEPVAAKLKTPELIAEADYLLGSAQHELHQYDAAAKSLQAALAAQPKWRQADDTLLTLAATERQQNKPAEAIATVRKMLTDFPQSKLLDRAHFRLGEFALASGDSKLAASEYQQVIEKWPASPLAANAWYGLGWAELVGKNYQQSIDTLTKLIDKFADNPLVPRARYARGMARQQLKQFDTGIEDVQAFLKSNPSATEKSDAIYVQGLCEVGLQKYGPAIEIFRGILKDDPSYAGADKVLYELAWALKSESKDAEAAETFGKLTKDFANSPLAPEAQFHVGEFHYQAKDYPKAAEAYFAAEKKPGTSELGEKAAHKLAWAYYQQAQYEKAQQGFDYQVSKYPQGELAADALFMAAESLFKQNKYEPASAAYQKSLAKLPANKDLQVLAELHAAQSLTQLQKWDAGLKLLTQAAKDFPDSPYMAEIQYEQGWAQQNLGKPDEAFKQYEEATALSDGLVGARARFMMGEILFEKKDYKEAVRNFFKVAYGYGYPQAPEAIQKWQANSAYEAARCFEVLKMTAQAKKSYQEVVDKYPNSDKAPLAKTRLAAL